MRINIFAGPGCGKSTVAAFLFAELKQRNVCCELVSEYIKSWAWEKRIPESWDQHYIFAKQLHAEDILVRRGVNTISDSPLWMQCAYMHKSNSIFLPEKLSECRKWDDKHPAANILLKRVVPYDPAGRYQNEDEALEMDRIVKKILDDNNVPYVIIPSTDKDRLVSYALQSLGDN